MTKVKVEFFKYTGKWYSSFEFETPIKVFEMQSIVIDAKTKPEFINGMDFTVEVDDGKGWNKYLFYAK